MKPEKEERKCAQNNEKHVRIVDGEQKHKKQTRRRTVCRRNNMRPSQRNREGGGLRKKEEEEGEGHAVQQESQHIRRRFDDNEPTTRRSMKDGTAMREPVRVGVVTKWDIRIRMKKLQRPAIARKAADQGERNPMWSVRQPTGNRRAPLAEIRSRLEGTMSRWTTAMTHTTG